MDVARVAIFLSSKKTKVVLLAFTLLLSFGPYIVAAYTTQELADDINCVLCRIIQIVFMIVGGVAALVLILAGLKWLTSGDDPGARQSAKTAIISAFVGLIIIFISLYVVSWLMNDRIPGVTLNLENWMSTDGCPC